MITVNEIVENVSLTVEEITDNITIAITETVTPVTIEIADMGVQGIQGIQGIQGETGAAGVITLTTTGTSGAATLTGSALNIPQYSGGGGGAGVWGGITGTLSAQTDLNSALSGKVDTVIGKSLVSDSEITRLSGVSNYDNSSNASALAGKQPLATVLTNTTASFTTEQETKLSGIATGATSNSSDATLLTRANHTGAQLASTISDIQTTITNNTAVLANTTKISFDSTSSTRLANTSGTNTGDNATNTQYSGLATSKQDTLVSTTNIKSINGNSILGSGDLTISGTGISSLNGLTGATQTFSVFTNFTGSPSFVSTGTNHQLKLPNAGPSTDYGLVTNGSQFIGGTKIFQSNPEIPVPAGNSGSCIVLGTTGGGGATGTLQIGSTTLYPTALEMQYVKGITSSVQTQLDSKASIVANITNDVYSGTIVWTGGAAPTVPNHTYSLSQVGNLVTLTINLAYTTAGSSLLTGVAMELPSTAPAPALPSSATAALDVINYGSGALQILNDSPTTAFATNTLLRIKSTGVYEVFITRGAGQYRHAYATIQYFV